MKHIKSFGLAIVGRYQEGTPLIFSDALAVTIGNAEIYLTMDFEGAEYYISF
jgi:hypothetical protein